MQKTGGYWREAAGQLRRVRSIAGGGMLSALGVALKSLTLRLTATLRINFAFLTAALCGYMYGPLVAGLAAVVVDILGFLVAPSGGAFHPGFTLNQFVNGVIYGLWLYRKPVAWWRCLGAVGTSMLVVSFILNPLWLSGMYGEAFLVLVAERVVKNIILLPIQTALLLALLQVAKRAKKQL